MTLQQLEYIVAVDKFRHFSKAAESVFVTQPTLSMMIQKLEEELEVTIFDRAQSPVEPTSIGKKIIRQARVTIAQANQIKYIVEEEKGIVRGVFRLGIIPTISPYLLPVLMQEHQTHNHDIKILVHEMTTDQILSALAHDTIDGGILATPLNEERMKEYPLYYEKFYAYVSPHETALYAKESFVENDLNNAKLWMLDEVHCFRTQILHLCRLKERRRGQLFTFEAGSIDTLIKIVDNNDGMTVIPEMAISNLSKTQRRNIRPFKAATPVREISLITRKEFVRQRMIDIIGDEVKAVVPESMLDTSLKKFIVPI